MSIEGIHFPRSEFSVGKMGHNYDSKSNFTAPGPGTSSEHVRNIFSEQEMALYQGRAGRLRRNGLNYMVNDWVAVRGSGSDTGSDRGMHSLQTSTTTSSPLPPAVTASKNDAGASPEDLGRNNLFSVLQGGKLSRSSTASKSQPDFASVKSTSSRQHDTVSVSTASSNGNPLDSSTVFREAEFEPIFCEGSPEAKVPASNGPANSETSIFSAKEMAALNSKLGSKGVRNAGMAAYNPATTSGKDLAVSGSRTLSRSGSSPRVMDPPAVDKTLFRSFDSAREADAEVENRELKKALEAMAAKENELKQKAEQLEIEMEEIEKQNMNLKNELHETRMELDQSRAFRVAPAPEQAVKEHTQESVETKKLLEASRKVAEDLRAENLKLRSNLKLLEFKVKTGEDRDVGASALEQAVAEKQKEIARKDAEIVYLKKMWQGNDLIRKADAAAARADDLEQQLALERKLRQEVNDRLGQIMEQKGVMEYENKRLQEQLKEATAASEALEKRIQSEKEKYDAFVAAAEKERDELKASLEAVSRPSLRAEKGGSPEMLRAAKPEVGKPRVERNSGDGDMKELFALSRSKISPELVGIEGEIEIRASTVGLEAAVNNYTNETPFMRKKPNW